MNTSTTSNLPPGINQDHPQFNLIGMEFFKDCPNCLGSEHNDQCSICQGLGIIEKSREEILDAMETKKEKQYQHDL